MKHIKKYRVIIIVLIVIALMLCTFFAFKSFLYPSDSKSVYGNRLDGIKDVPITSNKKMGVVNEIKTNAEVKTSSMNVQGTIINVIIRGKDSLAVDKAKEIVGNTMKKFSDKEKEAYDIQFFITGTKYTLIGYKNKTTADVVWTEVSEVDGNEEQAE